ncbi:MAG: NAD(P)-binding protein [Bacteroidetes bacterium]|jgi:predicted NAD/FAD-dependent oxidoreductase|nr:NAD(P)-binding protein [Bacteroidota bacterium]
MTLAIIGAGISGCAAAWALRTNDLDVDLFEKSRGVSGRAATRRRNGTCFDHGANYIKPTTERVHAIITEQLPTEDLVDIDRAVWTFDGSGTIAPGEDREGPMWTYRRGINTLGKLLLAGTTADLHRQTRVQRLVRRNGTWHIDDTEGATYGPYDAVLLTPPAPQAVDLIEASTFDPAVQQTVAEGLRAATYRSQFTIVLATDAPVPRPDGVYGLVNTDGAHPIAWLSFEEDKPGHVDEGSLLIAQMSPAWTETHYEAPHETLVQHAAEHVSRLLDHDVRNPAWSDHQRWRYALPNTPADATRVAVGQEVGLFVAGDALAGKGRVGLALESGLDAAASIREYLTEAAA